MATVSTASRFMFSTRKRTSRWQHLGAFALTGLLLMLAFPRPGWSVLAYVALVPAGIAAARTRDWRRLFWTAAVVFAVWWCWMLWWLAKVSPAGPPVLGVWLGVNVALGLLAAGVLNQKLRWPMAWALPMCWVSVEALRSVWPAGGFAWFSLAQSQAKWDTGDVGYVVQTADLMGQHTVGLVVALVNGVLVDVAIRRKLPRASVGLAVLVLGGSIGYGVWRVGQFDEATKPGPTIAVVQTNNLLDNAVDLTSEVVLQEWSGLVNLHREAVQSQSGAGLAVEAVVWPETVIPAPINEAGALYMARIAGVLRYEDETPAEASTRQALYGLKSQFRDVVPETVRVGGVATFVGANGLDPHPDFERTNSAYLIGPDGQISESVYHKQHRVPMGEYVPGPGFVEGLAKWMQVWPGYALTPGEGPVVFTLPGGWQVGTPICYEDAIAGVCREMVYGGASSGGEGKRLDALVNLTNDGWYTGQSMRRQHAQLASLRCIENRVPMARSVNTGISAFIDSSGRTQARLNEYEAGTLTHTMRVDSRTTLYAALGGWPWVLMVLSTIAATAFGAVFGRPLAKHRIA